MIELLSIPAIIAAVEAAKMAGVPSKYAGIVSIGMGIALGLAVGDWIVGAILGLSASGAYSGAKAVIHN